MHVQSAHKVADTALPLSSLWSQVTKHWLSTACSADGICLKTGHVKTRLPVACYICESSHPTCPSYDHSFVHTHVLVLPTPVSASHKGCMSGAGTILGSRPSSSWTSRRTCQARWTVQWSRRRAQRASLIWSSARTSGYGLLSTTRSGTRSWPTTLITPPESRMVGIAAGAEWSHCRCASLQWHTRAACIDDL
jgi:hypothetical protein